MFEIRSDQSAESMLRNIKQFRQSAEDSRHSMTMELGRASYIMLVEMIGSMFEHFFDDDSWLDELHSSMYWQIRELNDESTRPLPLLSTAFGQLIRWLSKIETELERVARSDEYVGSSARRIVLDSSALVRGTCFSEIDWVGILKTPEVKLFVPILVIQELDNLKNTGKEPKARVRLRKIRELLGDSGTGPVRVRDGVTLQLLMDPANHTRLPVNDQEITRRSKYLAGRPGGPLTLLTGDFTQEFVARAEGLSAMTLPDELTREALK